MTDSMGDGAQIRAIAEQLVDAAMAKSHDPQQAQTKILKWVAGIVSALVVAAVVFYFSWLTQTVGAMQITLARVDVRQTEQMLMLDSRFVDIDRRLGQLEARAVGAKQ